MDFQTFWNKLKGFVLEVSRAVRRYRSGYLKHGAPLDNDGSGILCGHVREDTEQLLVQMVVPKHANISVAVVAWSKVN